MPVVPFIPMIASTVGGIIGGKKAQSAAQQRSPEEQQALGGAQTAATNLNTSGAQLTDTGQDTQRPATSYFDTLLRGNRAQMAGATAAPRAALTDVYRGAGRNLEQSGVRGAQRDVASGELNRQRASQIGSLVTGVQPAAASALTSIGQTQTQQGLGATQAGGSLSANILGQGFQNRKYAREEGEKTGKGIGGLLFDVLKGTKLGGGGGSSAFSGIVPAQADFGSDEWMNH
jgi:hypothetical protein